MTVHKRSKRELLNFVGQILSWLFSVSTDSDLTDILKAINKLGKINNKIQHVVKKSLTVINMSHNEVIHNRERIHVLNTCIENLYKQLNYNANETDLKIKAIDRFIGIHFQLQVAIENTQQMLVETLNHIQNIQLQLYTVAIRKLTPSTVKTQELLNTLKDINNKLSYN